MKPVYRPLRLFGWIGFVLLIGSITGAIFALNTGNGAQPVSLDPANPVTAFDHSVVCYGYVDVEAGITSLYPLQPGRVVTVNAKENQPVKAGDILLKLDDRLADYRVREAKADLNAAVAQLDQAKSAPERHKSLIAQQNASLAATKARLAAARFTLERARDLEKSKLKNEKEVAAAAELVKELEAAVVADQEKLRELQTHDPMTQVVRAEADVAAKQARLDQAQYALAECSLRAPRDGQVLQVLVGPGAVLGPQRTQPVILFCPGTTRIVRAEVEQEFSGRVATGQPVIIQDESSNKNTWRGKVLRLSDWYTYRRSQAQQPLRIGNNDERTLECIIAIEASKDLPSLRLGQRVRVTTGKPRQ